MYFCHGLYKSMLIIKLSSLNLSRKTALVLEIVGIGYCNSKSQAVWVREAFSGLETSEPAVTKGFIFCRWSCYSCSIWLSNTIHLKSMKSSIYF